MRLILPFLKGVPPLGGEACLPVGKDLNPPALVRPTYNLLTTIYNLTPMITKETIRHLAALARIKISPEREEQLTKDVSKILDYVEALRGVNTDGLPEVSQVTGLKNVLRLDEVNGTSVAGVKKLLDCAPETENDYVKVKAVFDN